MRLASIAVSLALVVGCSSDQGQTSSSMLTAGVGGTTSGSPAGTNGSSAGASGAFGGASGSTAGAAGRPSPTLDAGAPPAGTVPAIVALGHGERTAVSCDGGRNFRINDLSKQPADDHSAYTAIGLAGGPSGFVAALGWGTPGRLLQSRNGVDWNEVPGGNVKWADGSSGAHTDSMSGAFFDGAYKVFWGFLLVQSADGVAWTGTTFRPTNIGFIREVEYAPGDGVLLMRVERDENGTRVPLALISTDGGAHYRELAPRTHGCPQYQSGSVAASHGVLLVGGDIGSLCRSTDMGATWAPVAGQGDGAHALFADATGFVQLRGTKLLRSDDGLAWTAMTDAGSPLQAGVWSKDSGYVAGGQANGQLFFVRSDDGRTWSRATVGSGAGFEIRKLRAGFVTPDARCRTP